MVAFPGHRTPARTNERPGTAVDVVVDREDGCSNLPDPTLSDPPPPPMRPSQ